ncbi:hypothetical protein D3C78_349210 [compost metagenome]
MPYPVLPVAANCCDCCVGAENLTELLATITLFKSSIPLNVPSCALRIFKVPPSVLPTTTPLDQSSMEPSPAQLIPESLSPIGIDSVDESPYWERLPTHTCPVVTIPPLTVMFPEVIVPGVVMAPVVESVPFTATFPAIVPPSSLISLDPTSCHAAPLYTRM